MCHVQDPEFDGLHARAFHPETADIKHLTVGDQPRLPWANGKSLLPPT